MNGEVGTLLARGIVGGPLNVLPMEKISVAKEVCVEGVPMEAYCDRPDHLLSSGPSSWRDFFATSSWRLGIYGSQAVYMADAVGLFAFGELY